MKSAEKAKRKIRTVPKRDDQNIRKSILFINAYMKVTLICLYVCFLFTLQQLTAKILYANSLKFYEGHRIFFNSEIISSRAAIGWEWLVCVGNL